MAFAVFVFLLVVVIFIIVGIGIVKCMSVATRCHTFSSMMPEERRKFWSGLWMVVIPLLIAALFLGFFLLAIS